MIGLLLLIMMVISPLARGSVSPVAFGSIQMLTVFALIIWFRRMFRDGVIRLKRTHLDIPIVIFTLLAAASIFRAPYTHAAIIEFLKLLNLIFIFYLVVNHIGQKRQIWGTVNLIVILGTALSLFGLIQYLGGIPAPWWSNKNFLSSVYVNHNHFAGLLEMCIPMAMGLILAEKNVEKRIFYAYLLMIMTIAFLFTMSRGAWLSMLISITIMFALLYKRRPVGKRLPIITGLVIVAGFFIVKGINLSLFLNRIGSYRELDFSGRLDIWKGTLEIIKENPLFGNGLGSFIFFFPEHRPEGFNLFANYAHNDYLQVWSELGIFGLVCMVFIFFQIVYKGFRTYLTSRSSVKRGISLGASIGILSIAIHSLCDFNLRIPANGILFSILAGLIFNLRSRKEGADTYFEFKLRGSLFHIVRPIFNVLAFMWILCLARLAVADGIVMTAQGTGINDKINRFTRALYILPEKSDYYKSLAQAYINKSSISLDKDRYLLMALEYYRRASEINPMDGWAWLGEADTFLYLGDIPQASQAYKKALALDPNNSYYLKRYGYAMADSGNVDTAVSILKRAFFLEKNRVSRVTVDNGSARWEYYAEKGDIYSREGNYEAAFNMYKIARALSPHNEKIAFKISELLGRMGKTDEDSGLNRTVFLNSRARFYISRQEYTKADDLVEQAMALNPADCVSLQNKIDILQRQKKPYQQISSYIERLLKLNNKDGAEISRAGKNVRLIFKWGKEGTMARSDIKKIRFILPLGLIEIKIFASGTRAEDEWPNMLVKLNSAVILSEYVSSTSVIEFSAYGVSREGLNIIQIEFSNDYWNPDTGEDRNLYIKKVVLEYKYPDYES